MTTDTAPPATGSVRSGEPAPGKAGRPPEGWRPSAPELVIAAVLIAATTVGVYGYAGLTAAELLLTCWAVVSLVLLRLLVSSSAAAADEERDRRGERSSTSFIGFWRKRGVLVDATASMASYDAELRVTLQHLLAARLAERHGISLYGDPAAARAAFLGSASGDLWFWLDPQRAAVTEQGQRGIPHRTLTAIIDRLERL